MLISVGIETRFSLPKADEMAVVTSLTDFFPIALLPTCAFVFGFIVVASYVRSYVRLRHIPGPRLWGLTIWPWLVTHTKADLLEQFSNLNTNYGSLVRVGPNTLICSDPDVIRRMSAPRSPYVRSDFYFAMRLNPGKDNIFSTMNETRHDMLRRKMAAGYAGKENETLESDIDERILKLCDLICKKYISSGGNIKPMDLARKISFLTLDITSKVAFDGDFENLRNDHDNFGYIAELEALLPNMTWTATVPGFLKLMTRIGLLQLAAKASDGSTGVAKLKSIAYGQVDKRFEADGTPKGSNKRDMLGSFLQHGLTREEAKEESILNMTAGSDTSATAIRATLLCILTNPRVYRNLVNEIDEATAKGTIPSEMGRVVSESQARSLPYLQACIKEGLRWYPPVAAEMSKVVPAAGDTICGYSVPGGVKIGYSARALHRTFSLFGPDPDSFRPERWLLQSDYPDLGHEKDSEKLKAMQTNNDLVFGYGKYQCLGKSVALLELNKVYVELFKRFDFEVLDPLNPWYSRCCGTFIQKDMWVAVRDRRDNWSL